MSADFSLQNYQIEVPERLIATHPTTRRGDSRLMIVDRKTARIEDGYFKDLANYLEAGDLLVLNDSKVLPSLVELIDASGKTYQTLFMPETNQEIDSSWLDDALKQDGAPNNITESTQFSRWSILAKGLPLKCWLWFEDTACFVKRRHEDGSAELMVGSSIAAMHDCFDRVGRMPLPPYIRKLRQADANELDKERYQTVYANPKGSIAAPTAGLHFTESLLTNLSSQGIDRATITLHVGRGTFEPIRKQDVRDHHMAAEWFDVPATTQKKLQATRANKKRVVGVGTTVTRTLESAHRQKKQQGWTDLYLYPSCDIRSIDALITNFHLPGSSLLLLVMAFAGEALIKEAYNHAVEKEYRFYSYGDAMLIV